MYCLPGIGRKKKRSKKSKPVSARNEEEVFREETTERSVSSELNVPVLTVTECADDDEKGGSHADSRHTHQLHKSLRPQPVSRMSDVGYESTQVSRTTLAPDNLSFHGRTSTESSGTSFHTAQSNSDPSPTSSGDIPPTFPAVSHATKSEMLLSHSVKEPLDKLAELVKHLDTSINTLTDTVTSMEEKIACVVRPATISTETQTMDMRTCASLQDVSEVHTKWLHVL